jgi:hypothetical protein
MVSTKGSGNENDGEMGRIVIGVNKQEDSMKRNWQFYDKYKKFKENKLVDWIPIIPKKSDTIEKSLGEGSNIIVEKKNIKLRVGDPDLGNENGEYTDSQIVLNDGSVFIEGSKSFLKIEREKGIFISNIKEYGSSDIKITSKGGCIIDSKQEIRLETPESIKIKSREFNANRNFKVLK